MDGSRGYQDTELGGKSMRSRLNRMRSRSPARIRGVNGQATSGFRRPEIIADEASDDLTNSVVDVITVLMVGLSQFVKVESLNDRLTGNMGFRRRVRA